MASSFREDLSMDGMGYFDSSISTDWPGESEAKVGEGS